MRWFDANPAIVRWNSEEVVVPYKCNTDGKWHRYFIDMMIEQSNGDIILVEIKPQKQTIPPKNPKRKTKKYLNEVSAYIKNTSKWTYAQEYAKSRGWKFQIWTEHTLKNIGVKMINESPKKMPKKKPYK
jgi:hypothetical protein